MRIEDLDIVACPGCRGPLTWRGRERDGHLRRGELDCASCGAWSVRRGVPRLVGRLGGLDRLAKAAYQVVAPVHDLGLRVSLPLFQGRGETEAAARAAMIERLALHELDAPPDRPVRILDIGVGSGRLLPLLERACPAPCELWGVDISPRMMGPAARVPLASPPRLLLADAHRLPFATDTFDRVVQVGAIGNFTDPAAALAEMVRVARPGGRLLVVDEQLDPDRSHSLPRRAAFRLVTVYQREAVSPVGLLPPGVDEIRDDQVSRFFYGLAFRKAPRLRDPGATDRIDAEPAVAGPAGVR